MGIESAWIVYRGVGVHYRRVGARWVGEEVRDDIVLRIEQDRGRRVVYDVRWVVRAFWRLAIRRKGWPDDRFSRREGEIPSFGGGFGFGFGFRFLSSPLDDPYPPPYPPFLLFHFLLRIHG
jgi:hypothetical protein